MVMVSARLTRRWRLSYRHDIGERGHRRPARSASPHVERVCGGVAHDRVLRCTKDERARWSAVVSLAPKKRLFLNVRRERFMVSLRGKKPVISTNGSVRSESRFERF